jgi:hypothetical protein
MDRVIEITGLTHMGPVHMGNDDKVSVEFTGIDLVVELRRDIG